MDLVIRLLDKYDHRSDFRSGNSELDRWFHRFAGQNQFRHHIGSTYVAILDDNIVGYVTVCPCELEFDELPPSFSRKLPNYPLPVLRLARLAVQEECQGKGLGKSLLRFVFQLAHKTSRELGCVGILVDAKAEALTFYRSLGFVELQANSGELDERPLPQTVFLSLPNIPEVP